ITRLVPGDAVPVGVGGAADLSARMAGLMDEAVGSVEEQLGERERRTDVGEVAAHDSSDVAGATEAAEDLPADRVVPVAKRRPAGARMRRPRPAAEHPVLGSEEHLG